MASSSPPPLKRRMGWLSIVLILLGVLIFVSIAGGYGGAVYYGRSRVTTKTEEVERLRQQGIPTNFNELGEWYHSDPEAQRRGEAFIKAFGLYKATPQFYREKDIRDRIMRAGDQMVPEHIDALRAHLDLNAEFMAELRRLLRESGEVQYPIDFMQGFKLDHEFAENALVAVSMFIAAANIAALDRDVEGVVRNLGDAIHMNETLRTVPVLIVQLIRNAGISIIVDQHEYAVNAVRFPLDQLREAQLLLGGLQLDGMIALGMIGELCLFDEDVLFSGETAAEKTAPYFGVSPSRVTFLRDTMVTNLFLSQCEVIRIGDVEPWNRRPLAEQFDQKIENQRQWLHMLETILAPAATRTYEAENRILGVLAIARTGLAVLRYAGDTGALPESLDALVPKYMDAVPRDAFDGQPVRYKLTETGFVVYSIAHDRVDNAGAPAPDDKKIYETGDLLFRVFDVAPYLQQKDAA